jgi:cell division septation protein DedD
MTRDVTIYIKELLFGHDCVIVPGFGAFIGNYSPARIDHTEGLFCPPVKKITFNRHLINNDGLLIGHISSREGIGYGEARDLAASFADELRKRIGSGERVLLNNIGTFFNNREGLLIFEPDADANYLLSSFGLTSFHRTPVKDFDIRRKVLEHYEKVPGKTTSMRRMLTRAAVIIPLLVAMALIPFRSELFNSKVQETNMNPLAIAELEYNRSQILNVTPATDTSSSTETVSAETKTSDSQTTAAVVPQTTVDNGIAVPIDETETKYILVTGSFQSEENALSMVRNLQAKGFSPDVAAGPNGFFRVCAGTYNTSEEANAFLRKMKSTYPGSWVCKTK